MAYTTPTFTITDVVTAAGGDQQLVDAAIAHVNSSGGRGTAATLLAICKGTA